MKLLLSLLLLSSCAGVRTTVREGKNTFNFHDVSGSFRLQRESKVIKNKLVSRFQLFAATGSADKLVEKSIVVSQPGSIKTKKGRSSVLRPLASDFTVWLEGKAYSSKMNLDPQSKSMKVTLKSPESKWSGTQSVKFPKGTVFCFYSQIPECLIQSGLLSQSFDQERKSLSFHVVWESFPYTSEQYTNVSGNLFAPATIRFDGIKQNMHRFEVELEGQILLYYFSKSFEFAKMSWIAQGLTISTPGDEEDEE